MTLGIDRQGELSERPEAYECPDETKVRMAGFPWRHIIVPEPQYKSQSEHLQGADLRMLYYNLSLFSGLGSSSRIARRDEEKPRDAVRGCNIRGSAGHRFRLVGQDALKVRTSICRNKSKNLSASSDGQMALILS